jgi:hypothetical protein
MRSGDQLLLIVGGAGDINVTRLLERARAEGVHLRSILIEPHGDHRIHWDLESNDLLLDGEPVSPSALFARRDVFATLAAREEGERLDAERCAAAWHAVIRGWCATHTNVRMLNRAHIDRSFNKPGQLYLSRQFGLPIPRTIISNDRRAIGAFAATGAGIVKPVNGGQFTHALAPALAAYPADCSALPVPAIVQNALVSPEIRVFLIGDVVLAFEIDSPHLDYRADPDGPEVTEASIDDAAVARIVGPLRHVARALGLDFCAADFKTDPRSGDLVFLEINEQPMFARFDHLCDGRLCDAILALLGFPSGS